MSRDLIMQVRELVQRYQNANINQISKKLFLNSNIVQEAIEIIKHETKNRNHT